MEQREINIAEKSPRGKDHQKPTPKELELLKTMINWKQLERTLGYEIPDRPSERTPDPDERKVIFYL